ncbi:FKBP-type peptidyl-prolyl cis-trans isomerase [Moraxella nasicaprae]|uniref:Peptidyl-prolyl cis-trans isomerase n=1 Tax=Moraxella nasicaprae TaxID=2904122 RepID=A0ABY6F212_9GAMM|nr:FKBP-type peptidyl-prolyl cis-trans isomerase [Moraxella nasicaprae]UXZ04116.1 FKBP-type peptidyl-prolyl cis-trans isomerase [Moraxella nasicaprae]
MKKHILVSAIVAALALTGCNKDKEAAPADGKAAKSTVINEKSTEMQKVSFLLGFNTGKDMKELDSEIDLDIFYKAMKDGFNGKENALTDEEIKELATAYEKRKTEEAKKKFDETAAKNKADGEKFLAENAKKEGVQTTASGLQYKVITEGTGKQPKATDTVVVHYEGKLLDGKVFDSSYERQMPAQFQLNQVIKGWTEGLQLMKEGSKYEFYVPSELAYGAEGNQNIEPNSVLIFTVELLTEAQAKEAVAKAQAELEKQMKAMQEAQAAQQSAGEAKTDAAGQDQAKK